MCPVLAPRKQDQDPANAETLAAPYADEHHSGMPIQALSAAMHQSQNRPAGLRPQGHPRSAARLFPLGSLSFPIFRKKSEPRHSIVT
jgi:hypothetical protein